MKILKDRRIACRKIEGNYFIVSPWDHKLHKLNETGTLVFELLEKGLGKKDIVKRMTGEFNVSAENAEKDFDEFIGKIEKKGLCYKEK